MTPRTGRPPVDNPRRNAVHIRLTDDELAACQAAADRADQNLGQWMRDKAIAAARRSR